jgi:GNAT superfamily N-acetyltransferase
VIGFRRTPPQPAEPARPRVFVGDVTGKYRDRVREIVAATGVFSDAEVSVAVELFDSAFPAGTDYYFLGAFTPEDELTGFACYGPTPSTDNTWDLYWIAVHPSAQKTGSGTILINEVERRLLALNARLLVVETSSRSDYKDSRSFYLRRGYVESARARDFYAPSDDRITYTKRLQSRAPAVEWMAHGAMSQ